jgi:hypothetical protein
MWTLDGTPSRSAWSEHLVAGVGARAGKSVAKVHRCCGHFCLKEHTAKANCSSILGGHLQEATTEYEHKS